MKYFVLHSINEKPILINETNFEEATKRQYPYVQTIDSQRRYFAICPLCDNPIQIRGLYKKDRKKEPYGAHTGKNIKGLNRYIQENYEFCPYAQKGIHLPKDVRKEIVTKREVDIYNLVRDKFNYIVYVIEKHIGMYVTDRFAKELLESFYVSEGWKYPYITSNNIPWMLLYLFKGFNPYGRLIAVDSGIEREIDKCNDLLLEGLDNNDCYRKLKPAKKGFIKLTAMFWNHQILNENEVINETVDFQISEDVGYGDEVKWKTLINLRLVIEENVFLQAVHSHYSNTNRDTRLLILSHEILKPLNFVCKNDS